MKKGLFFLFIHLHVLVLAQGERKLIREGNDLFYKNENAKAEEKYKEAIEKSESSFEAKFNLGDALYKQGKYEESQKIFESLTNSTNKKEDLSKVYHNLGNSHLKKKEYEKSVNAYKNALRNNPTDDDTRYNLAYAQKMIQQQQNQQNKDKKDQEKKDQKDKDDKKDQEKQDQKKDDQKQDKNDQDKQDQKQDQQKHDKQEQGKPEESKMSKEEAKRLLDAINNQEKDVQDKLKKQKGKVVRVQVEKDW